MTPEIIENLIKVSESLDKKGLTEQSSVIDSFSGKLINLMKSAQYVGPYIVTGKQIGRAHV